MKHLAVLIAAFMLFDCQLGLGEQKPITANLKDLIETPQKFDGKAISVQGFLVIETQPRHASVSFLYFAEDSPSDGTARNGIVVVPSQEMQRERERISHKYIRLTGIFRATPTYSGKYVSVIKEIRAFVLEPEPGTSP